MSDPKESKAGGYECEARLSSRKTPRKKGERGGKQNEIASLSSFQSQELCVWGGGC